MKALPVIKKDGKYFAVDESASDEVKPGKSTTEALSTLIGSLLVIAAAAGYISPEQSEALNTAITVGALPAIYALCRTALKIVKIFKG